MTERKPQKLATLIAGPTASGKSALATRLAGEQGALVVNADSMQVYTELRILTARPTETDEAATPHRLYGFRPASEPYSVAAWLADIAPLIAAARDGRSAARHRRRDRPLFQGASGRSISGSRDPGGDTRPLARGSGGERQRRASRHTCRERPRHGRAARAVRSAADRQGA